MWTLNAEAVNINIHKFHKANGRKINGWGVEEKEKGINFQLKQIKIFNA